MTGIETNFDLRHWKRQIQQLADEITKSCAELPDTQRRDRMIEAVLTLNRATDKLDFARAIPGDSQETQMLLKLSVQEFKNRRRGMKQCEQIGSDVLPTNEKAHATNVSPFFNRQLFQSGE